MNDTIYPDAAPVPQRTALSQIAVTASVAPSNPVTSDQTNPPVSKAAIADKPIVRRLGDRLTHLFTWAIAAGPYDDIWDLCCDHGRLGLHLYDAAELAQSRVHLVDCVPAIISLLRCRYGALLGKRLAIECLDAGVITLPPERRQLIVLAGIGGASMVSILEKIVAQVQAHRQQGSTAGVEFLLSPNSKTFALRCFLREHSFELVKEEFVTEKRWHHEHLHLRYHGCDGNFPRTTATGSSLWYPLTMTKKRYISKLIAHYKKCVQLGQEQGAKVAVDAYSALLASAAD